MNTWARRLDDENSSSGGNEDVVVVVAVIVVVLFLTIIALRFILIGINTVQQAEVMIIERFGRYNRTLKPGLHWIWPIIESPRTYVKRFFVHFFRTMMLLE